MQRQSDKKVGLRIHVSGETATRLNVAAAIRGMTISQIIEWALLPHLEFPLPELLDVEVRALPPGSRPKQGRGVSTPPTPRDDQGR